MSLKATPNHRHEIQEALCAAIQVARDPQTRNSLVSILTDDGGDGPSSGRRSNAIAQLYFNSCDQIAYAIESNVPNSVH